MEKNFKEFMEEVVILIEELSSSSGIHTVVCIQEMEDLYNKHIQDAAIGVIERSAISNAIFGCKNGCCVSESDKKSFLQVETIITNAYSSDDEAILNKFLSDIGNRVVSVTPFYHRFKDTIHYVIVYRNNK